MAYQKLQVSLSLPVIPSDSVRIPNPDTFVTSNVDGNGSVAGTFSSALSTFITDRVRIGAIIYATSKAYEVLSVDSETSLSVTVADGVVAGAATTFQIYNEATPACILFVGITGNVSMQLAQQNGKQPGVEYLFKNIADASFLPTQVVRVGSGLGGAGTPTKTTTAENIIALW
tara:strand:+ start:62 stop:580 length:519 start_codon:yes stop_codon:yes gene_type:complete